MPINPEYVRSACTNSEHWETHALLQPVLPPWSSFFQLWPEAPDFRAPCIGHNNLETMVSHLPRWQNTQTTCSIRLLLAALMQIFSLKLLERWCYEHISYNHTEIGNQPQFIIRAISALLSRVKKLDPNFTHQFTLNSSTAINYRDGFLLLLTVTKHLPALC